MRTMSVVLITFMSGLSSVIAVAGCDPAEAEPQAQLDEDIDDPELCLEPGRIYVSDEPEVCRAILFICEPGMVIFNDGCGCGCVALPQSPVPEPGAQVVTAALP